MSIRTSTLEAAVAVVEPIAEGSLVRNRFQLQVDYDEFGFPAGPNTTSPEDRDWNQDTNADRPKAFERTQGQLDAGERPFENYFKVRTAT